MVKILLLSLLLFSAGVCAGGTNDVEINLGPTYPQTIELQDGTNTLSLVVAAQSILQITNIVVVTEEDFQSIVLSLQTTLEELQYALESYVLASLTNAYNYAYELEDNLLWLRDHANLDEDNFQVLDDSLSALRSLEQEVASGIDDLRNAVYWIPLIVDELETDFESSSQVVPVLVYADMTLSPASGGSGCNCADLLAAIHSVLVSIDGRVALSNQTLQEFRDRMNQLLVLIRQDLGTILRTLESFFQDWSDVINILADNGFLDFYWEDLQMMVLYINSVMDQVDRANGGSGSMIGLGEFGWDLAKFYDFWSKARGFAVSNFVDRVGEPIPLLVEIANPITNDWPLAWAVTNFVDDAGEKVPLLVTEDVGDEMSDMESRADALTRSDADIDHWERFPTGIDWEDIKRNADFTSLETEIPTRVTVVSGYDFSWSMGDESDSFIVDYGYWDLSTDERGFFGYVHDFFRALWYFVVGILPCSLLFWWSFLFGVRATYFAYAILTGRDTARAFGRLGALRGFMAD